MPQAALCFDKVTDQDPGSGSGIQTRRKRRSRRRGRGKRSVDVNGNVIGNHDLDWDKESFEKTSRDIGEQKGRHQMGHRGGAQSKLPPSPSSQHQRKRPVAAPSKPPAPKEPTDHTSAQQTNHVSQPNDSDTTHRRRPRRFLNKPFKWPKKRNPSYAVEDEMAYLALLEPQKPVEREDWEEELRGLAMPIAGCPYDFEDVIDMSTIFPRKVPTNCLTQLAPYVPSEHHSAPVKWQKKLPPPPVNGQFSDAEEEVEEEEV
ncbi:uncharacterized protein LOC134465998 isoform X2 [Engraulis encrasicolus]